MGHQPGVTADLLGVITMSDALRHQNYSSAPFLANLMRDLSDYEALISDIH